MARLDAWDLALLALAGYVAVMALVRMMQWRRDAILDELAEQIKVLKERQRLQKKKEQKKRAREQAQRERAERRDAA